MSNRIRVIGVRRGMRVVGVRQKSLTNLVSPLPPIPLITGFTLIRHVAVAGSSGLNCKP